MRWLCALCITLSACSTSVAADESGSRAGASPKYWDNNLTTGPVSPNAAHYPAEYDGDGEEDELISPQTYVHCCPLASRIECQEACLAALKMPREIGISQVMDSLQRAGCEILLHDPLTQCFIARSAPKADSPVGRVGQDAAKLHCCGLAREPQCRRLCHRAFSTDWAASASQLHEQCLVSANETSLASCLDEVDWPCSGRCSGLDFCAPVAAGLTGTWFRSCSAEADAAARSDVSQWQRDGLVRGSSRGALPLARSPDSSSCGGEVWRALACTLHIRPCDPRAGSLSPCKADCLALVTQCVDWLQVTPGFSARAICGELTDAPSCVPVRGLLQRERPAVPESAVPESVPVVGAPVLGCSLGDVSGVSVVPGTAVHLVGNGSASCPQACVCGHSGKLEGCVSLPCPSHQYCRVGTELLQSRQTVFRDCMVCSCSWGKLTCVQRWQPDCPAPQPPGARCHCAPHYMPVCGRDGRTYRNPCLAACAGLAGLHDARPGSCGSKDPCAGNPCPGNSQCVPARRVCLSLQQGPCPQHQCVPLTNCGRAWQPSCDTSGKQYINPCSLLKAGRTLAYLDPCVKTARQGAQHLAGLTLAASPSKAVCGADGETYPSEAAALVARVPVDFLGPCGGACGPCRCSDARPPVPGACCPPCPEAGVLHAALAVKELDRAVLTLGASWSNMARVFTLTKLLEDLQQVVLEDDCRVLGYLTQDEELVVVLWPLRELREASTSQCRREAARLAGLFEQSSARLQSLLLLSAVVAVDVLEEPLGVEAAAAVPSPYSPALLVLVLVASSAAQLLMGV